MLRKRTSKTGELTGRDRMRALMNLRGAPEAAPQAAAAPEGPAAPLDPLMLHDTLGEALKAARLDKGLTLVDVADRTRVRRAYLEAIEDMRLDALPSRPFTIGYIRAYATFLGLDPELAIERFKSDEPVLEETLRAPVGMIEEKDPRVAAFLIGALVIIAAIVLWNVAQRAMMAAAPPPPLAPQAQTTKALEQIKSGTMELGYPLPAPVESTTPPPYETPGLAASTGLKADPNAPATPTPPATRMGEPPPVDLASLPATFAPLGRVYDSGNPKQVSVVTVQAIKAGALIVRGPDGSVYFARQLAKGEAYRVPQLAGLTLDVSAPHDFQVFVAGQSRGVLPAQQVLASKLGTTPTASAAPPRPATAAPAPVAAPPLIRPPPPAARPPAP
ncbi:MAG: helix-turn-helix domain-containing protein [Alphaproteobacteria bacterium]|nr:helix-turn-helix domain-containing protein [Alphaproteobacteria bacterium]MBU1515448.1 helix-turn-helix domain-containing protein [Alphaproteobacteria bacterium]MBU2095446.1 helix-turn-helix domain-containing protein [Alphaproteobacteria bacterium]MBU2150688.1 helix-turn-helix domain-containing protein [Alphaproteobacteria bacterium]MBU2306952.1 helix-turn-helix domain-containing protein [Alphaproteobacteria bacterium]